MNNLKTSMQDWYDLIMFSKLIVCYRVRTLFYWYFTKLITAEMLEKKTETMLFALKEIAILWKYRQYGTARNNKQLQEAAS